MLEPLPLFAFRTVEGIFCILGCDDVRSRLKRDDVHGLVRIQVGCEHVLKHLTRLHIGGVTDAIHKNLFELKLAEGIIHSCLHACQWNGDCHTHPFGFIIVGHPTQAAIEIELPIILFSRSFKVIEVETNLQLLGQSMTILDDRAAGIDPGLDSRMHDKAVGQQVGNRHREQLLAIVNTGHRECVDKVVIDFLNKVI